MRVIQSTGSTGQVPPRQEIGEYHPLSREGIHESAVRSEQNPADTDLTEFYVPGNADTQKNPGSGSRGMTTATGVSEFYEPRPEDDRHDQGQLGNFQRVDTVNL